MNHLGGMEGKVCVEWLHKSSILEKTCVSQVQYTRDNLVSHLWKATQEQRDFKCQMLRSFSAATWQYGLCLDHIGCNNLARWRVGGRGDRFGTRPFWSKGRLLKDLVSMHVESCGESAPPLERVKYKYLAVFPAMDNLSIKIWKQSRISSSQFLC